MPDFIFAADVNRDRKLDIVFYSQETSDGPVVFLGNGNGALSFFGKGPFIPFTPYVAVGDVDGDGIPDVVTAQHFSAGQSLGGITVLHGNGDGTFRQTYQYQFPSSDMVGAGGVAIADVNRDGNADIILTDIFNGTIYVFLGLGGGTFQLLSTPAASIGPGQIVTGDFDGDGNLDLAIAIALESSTATQPPYSAVSFMFGAGDGTFPSTVTLQLPGMFYPRWPPRTSMVMARPIWR